MKKINTVWRMALVALIALAASAGAPSTLATVVILTNGNATAAIDTQSKAGMYDWIIEGTDVLKKQWFWYRVGSSGGEQSIDSLTQSALVLSASDPIDNPGVLDTLFVKYTSAAPPFRLDVIFTLAGGSPGSRSAALTEQIAIRNTGTEPLEFHFFQYGDFALDPLNPLSDVVLVPSLNLVNQSNPNSSVLDVSTAPIPSHHEVNVFTNAVNTLINLEDASPTTLSDVSGPLSGNATWAFQWDAVISAGGTYQISKNKKVTLARPPQQTKICVHKFYDANLDGIDDGQPIAGWRFDLFGTESSSGNNVFMTGYTDASGNLCFTNLTAGLYTVTEVAPNPNWVATTAASVTTNLLAGQTPSFAFGNVCKGGEGGLTIGFWRNKNGQALIVSNDFTTLTALCLRNADGSDRDFTSTLTANKDALKSWLQGANAINMAYMLSAQLAAMQLNVLHGSITNNAAAVFAPGCGNTGPGNNFITLNNLIAAANNALCADGYTPTGDPNRALQECLKNALDDANNNRNLIEAAPCSFDSPY
jgi:hypothetical protein